MSNAKLSKKFSDKSSQGVKTYKEILLSIESAYQANNKEGNICKRFCGPENLPAEPVEDEQKIAQFQSARAALEKLRDACSNNYQASKSIVGSKITVAAGAADSAGNTWKAFKWGAGIGAAAIVGGIVYKDKQDDKKEKEKKKKLEKEFESGIARKEDGTKTNCLTPGTYANPECKPVLQNYCSKDENAHKGGCVAFQNKICSEADASQSYCVGKDVKAYCKQEGPLIAQSPACIWVSGRPKSCDTDPENVQCLTTMTPAQLNAECPKFPNDPLCQAHLAGKVVTQPMSESAAAEYATTNTNSAGGINNLIGSSDQSSITAQSNWKSTSSAYRKLCANKQLRGCN
jgi:hypothetical protein